ncbi:MAG: Crp/Fnr family transcriptional regulator [Devosia sp.]|nr:Crp/Fnr family transcriptional regulator [Devosia sp.]
MIGMSARDQSPARDPSAAAFPFADSPRPPRSWEATSFAAEDAPDVVRWRIRRRRGQTVYQEGEPATTFYRVEAGCVRLLLYSSDGRRQIVGFCFPGDLFGFSLGPRDCTAESSTDVDLTAISSAAFMRSTRGQADQLMQVSQRCLGHYRAFAEHVLCIRSLPAAERIAACLETFALRLVGDGAPSPLPFSQIELSDFLGLSPETTSREVRKLCAAGRVARAGRKLLLLRPASQTGMGRRRSPAAAEARPLAQP